ncbi:MAG: LPXTG cell wall anchor domain-containing protein [Ilumatobacter sp.]|uniref:LPXTG cell wall anchor domain-containing protein n=1 Tax=Ilumatobacter sp. TaxID=1967498 RepID=UPI00260EF97F|nr:LPXTG cell wall anchor domain-containing protein [Ilumatobacter sp.]MDJ0770785.1 LPXTG cell wall anchor domain-containing protein [Ilumatobacter sp.]
MDQGRTRRWAGAAVIALGLAVMAPPVFADGTETLGDPSVPIAAGTGAAAAGVGTEDGPATFTLDVPAGATVTQVLAYWEGQHSAPGTGADDTVSVNGNSVTGTLIGGPTFFFSSALGQHHSSTYRADITQLGIIAAGSNSVTVSDMDFDLVDNGFGLIAIYDDGGPEVEIGLVDGNDLAFINFPAPLDTTVPQVFTFEPAPIDRIVDIVMFASSVEGPDLPTQRPNSIEVIVDGVELRYSNLFGSFDGAEWDTVMIEVPVPAGVGSLSVQALSADDLQSNNLPASFAWLVGMTIVQPFVPPTTTTTTTTSTTTTTTSTTLPPTTTTTSTTTTTTAPTTTTTTSTTTTTTTLPCEWDPQLPPDSPDCVPSTSVTAICFDIDVNDEVERYWHRLTNNEDVPIDVTWIDGSATIPANGSVVVSSASETFDVLYEGRVVATSTAPEEFCQQDVIVEKVVEGPEREPGDPAPVYTIQVSRLVGDTFVPESETFELTAGESITVPLPSTLNPEGITYKIEEVDAGNASATSVTPNDFILNGHKNETTSVVIANTFAAISLEKTVDKTSVQPGDELNYTLIAENTGALTLDPVTIFDRLPPEVIYEDGNYEIVGGEAAGSCTLVEATRPQLVRCDLAEAVAPGEFTPAITLLVTVDPELTSSDAILNQSMAIGNYLAALEPEPLPDSIGGAVGEGRWFVEQAATDLSCDPAPGEVCDLSARTGVSVDIPVVTTTSVAQQPPTTTIAPTTTVVQLLPRTGSDNDRPLILMGMLLVMLGAGMILSTRRKPIHG